MLRSNNICNQIQLSEITTKYNIYTFPEPGEIIRGVGANAFQGGRRKRSPYWESDTVKFPNNYLGRSEGDGIK